MRVASTLRASARWAGLALASALLSLGPVRSVSAQSPALDVIEIEADGLVFTARAAGPDDGPLVLLLHGFPQTSFAFRHQLDGLGALGYRAVAPDQRGYSPGARPSGVEAYAMTQLSQDVVRIADALGAETFDLVGHDWGGAVAWVAATRFQERVRTLTVLSTPHYAALSAARGLAGSDQARRSSYFTDFAAPDAAARLLDGEAAALRAIYGDLDPDAVDVYLSVLANEAALEAALAWYAAAFGPRAGSVPPPTATPSSTPVRVPTLYVWSTDDGAFGREAAEATGQWVEAPYRFEVLEGVDHWVAERVPQTVTRMLVEHLESRVGPRPGTDVRSHGGRPGPDRSGTRLAAERAAVPHSSIEWVRSRQEHV